MWLLPALLLVTAIVLSNFPISAYFAWLMDGKYHAPRFLRWFEELIDTGPQDWKQYVLAMLVFSVGLFVFGYRRSLPAADRAAQSARARLARADDDLQHGHILYDQHQSAALFGRSEFLEFQPDLLHSAEHVPFGLDRLLRAGCDHPRLPGRSDGWQFLRRYVARLHVHLPAGRADLRRHLHVAGHADDLCLD